MTPPATPSRRTLAHAIRFLAADAVQQAGSGHPGMPMGMADIAEVLWRDFLKHNPANPDWFDRDRVVLSNGHGSMLLYALLHLTGYDLPADELRNFRQLHSRTPGHPEYGVTPGVETTTGPLGQGFANAVGMALAEKLSAEVFNRPGLELVNHRTWTLLGDGCLMEGISQEAASLAGVWGLGKLTALYDSNRISIDGEVDGWFADDTAGRFRACRWHVVEDVDGHDPDAVRSAIVEALGQADRPSLIICGTRIGWGAPSMEGAAKTHGSPLGEKEIAAMRQALDWPHPPFEIPEEICRTWDARTQGAAAEAEWRTLRVRHAEAHPELAAAFDRRLAGELPGDLDLDALVRRAQAEGAPCASRKASQQAIGQLAPHLDELLGGSADLTGSNLTDWDGASAIHEGGVRYIHYGVREFGMAAIMNGIALHGLWRPFGGTFLVFADYARNGIRLSALMNLPVVYVFTHDSIGLGEDGPTHQPVEHLAMLRATPNLHCWRSADDVETFAAWAAALERGDGPTALVLSRQGLGHFERDQATLRNIRRGGYILHEARSGRPERIVIATGSEVGSALEAIGQLGALADGVRLVSMPCVEVFEQQDAAYRDAVLPPDLHRRMAIEAGCSDCWGRWVGLEGRVLGIDRFGDSAPGAALFAHFGLDAAGIAGQLRDWIGA
ncbi:MAG: transketolase [Gammaproteobacteria bacterium AqS3]|nr:transketolase [Gammaproteobacteria bacterium AqS3]